MSLHETARWIVTYDITCPKRGTAVHRFMKKQGVPVQFSVFLVEASASEMHQLMLALEELIAVHADDVRAYRWPVQPECHSLGKSMLPDGVLISHTAPRRKFSKRAQELA
jgi:CRISPR-associated protein Cas2